MIPSPVLITGAGGFVGGHLRRTIAERQPSLDVIATGLSSDQDVTVLDLTAAHDVDALIARERPRTIIHLAAQASVAASQADGATRTWTINLGGTLNLAAAIAHHVPEASVLFASSSEVYGKAFGGAPLDEDVVPRPVAAYARSKLMAEQVLAEVLPATARLIVTRPFNHTGPGQREAFALPSFAAQIARIEAGAQPPVLRVGNLDAQRDLLDVRDVVAAYLALLEAAPRLPMRGTFNIASGTARPMRRMLDGLLELTEVPLTVEVDPARMRPSDIPYAAGQADRLRELTGWAPTVPFEETLASVLDDARRRLATAKA